jgi:hypothetical protein
VRNLVDAGFPLFRTQIYHKLGNQGAASLLAGLAVLMVPVPFVLGWYGSKRERSRWASIHVEGDRRAGADEANQTDQTYDKEPKLGGKDSGN